MNLDFNRILEEVDNHNLFLRLIVTVIGTFLLAFNYNMFLEPNNLVIGGLSGISIVTKKLFSLNPTTFIYIATAVLVVIGFFLLDKKDMAKAIFVSILFPFLITFTAPLCDILIKHFEFSDKILLALFSAITFGFANGIIYEAGFNTGGMDILMKILNKYAHIPEGKANFILNIAVIILGGIVFDINNVAYSAIIVYISSMIIDRMLIGISTSKLFYINTNEVEKVKQFIIEELKTGVTVINVEGGFFKKKKKLLMCAVDNMDYYLFKESILAIDPNAFIIINDCYEVSGGVKRERINILEG